MDKGCCAQPMPPDLGGTFSASGRRPCPTCALDLLDPGFWLARFQRAAKLDWEEGRGRKHLEGSRSLPDKCQRPGAICLGVLLFQSNSGEGSSPKQTKLGETTGAEVHQGVQSSPTFTATVPVLLLDVSNRTPLRTLKMCLLIFTPHLK